MLCGLARLIMCVAEVPFFYLSGPLIRRLGVRAVIALAQLAYLTRFIYYSVRLERVARPVWKDRQTGGFLWIVARFLVSPERSQ